MPIEIADPKRASAHRDGARTFLSALFQLQAQLAFTRLPMWLIGAASICSATANTPVTPNASREARALFAFLEDTYGKRIISGQQEGWRGTNELGFELAYIRDASGKLPALLAMDLAPYTQPRTERRSPRRHEVADHAIDWYVNRNGIVSLCWHWAAPMHQRVFYTKDTSFRPAQAVLPGTPEHEAALRDIDLIAAELKLLQDAGVPVLWRPLHEANGRWFWWGADGPEPLRKLWKILFERLTVKHKLNNLIWVFSPGAGIDGADWYPGDPYVDVIAPDHYPMDGNTEPAKNIFDEMVGLGGGMKLVAFGENGPIPAPDKLEAEKANWLFFIAWSGKVLTDRNPKDYIKTAYNHPYVLTLEDLPLLRSYAHAPVGKAAKLAFSAMSDLAVGSAGRRPVVVTVQDSNGRIVRDGKYRVTLALQTNPSNARLLGATTTETVNGVAVFPDMAISKAGKGFVLSATCKSLRPATSGQFNVGPGAGMLRESWIGKSNANGGNPFERKDPSDTSELLGKAFESPVALATNFTARFRGHVIPPVTGEYTFWVANDGISQLWLSTNSAPEGKLKIAEIQGSTPYAKWPHTHEAKSQVVSLQAGRRYYIEAVQHQGAGSTHFWVRWRLPDGTEECPIPGFRFTAPAEATNVVSTSHESDHVLLDVPR